jgi:hypothetical protein
MILIAALATWLILVLFFVVLCRGAASADGRGFASTERYPTGSANGPRTNVPGLVLLESQPTPVARDLRTTARGARGRAGQYAAGS